MTRFVTPPARFTIFADTYTGERIECFRWCRDANSGIARAYAEGLRFGYRLVHVWAEPIEAA